MARMPTPGEARKLALSPGMPVIRILRTVYDAGNRPLEVQDTVAVADKHPFRFEVDMRWGPVTARLRVGACLSLSGRFAQLGQQAAAGLKTWATMRWKPALNAFAITFSDRFPAAETY